MEWWKYDSDEIISRPRPWCHQFLPVGQPPVSQLLSRRFWGFSPRSGDTIHGLAWNWHGGAYPWIFGVSGSKNCQNFQLFRPAGANPLPDGDEIRQVYAGNRSTKAINIWCDSVSKLGIYGQKLAMGHSPPKKKFRCPLAPKLLVGFFLKIKGVQKWYGHPLS